MQIPKKIILASTPLIHTSKASKSTRNYKNNTKQSHPQHTQTPPHRAANMEKNPLHTPTEKIHTATHKNTQQKARQ